VITKIAAQSNAKGEKHVEKLDRQREIPKEYKGLQPKRTGLERPSKSQGKQQLSA
jgi:hypothetical protein